MLPQRTPLRDTNSNRRYRGTELSPYARGEIVGLSKGSKSIREIELELNVSRGAVRYTLDQIVYRDDGKTLPRYGTPVTYDSRSRRRMLLCLRNHPKMTYDQRRDHTGLKMSNSYIYYLAIDAHLSHWRAKKRPELTDVTADSRLLWCRCRAH